MRFNLIVAAVVVATPLSIVAAAQDWSTVIARTAMGSFVQGNPKAKVKLVEYISFTCNHCANFYGESAAEIDRRVKSGGTSVEFRHAVRDPLDLTASILARCGGPKRFHGHAKAILAAQPDWVARGAVWQEANAAAMGTMSVSQRLQGFAVGSGLIDLVKARGLTAKAANACLANADEQKTLSAMAKTSFAAISGTPSFAVNGAIVPDAHSWAALEPALVAAGSK